MENIQVALRCRPLSKKEVQRGEDNGWNIANNNNISISPNYYKDLMGQKRINFSSRISYPFDYCFNVDDTNSQVYNTVVKRVALSSLNGINGTVFMYGQTGSGKTYTMMGYRSEDTDPTAIVPQFHGVPVSPRPMNRLNTMKSGNKLDSQMNYDDNQGPDSVENSETFKGVMGADLSGSTGILIMALRDIFNAIENDMDKTYFLRCSYVEIYNDNIYDLLKTPDKLGETLTVNEDAKRDFYIKGVVEESVSSITEILEKLRKGEANRHYAATAMNHTSSRSHTIFRLSVQTLTNNFIRDYRREHYTKASNINNDILIKFVNAEGTNMGPFEDETLKKEGTMVTESLLNFVDLAGSEKVSNHHMMYDEPVAMNVTGSDGFSGLYGKETLMKTANVKDRVKEGQHINKSLFFLTQVISLKSEGKNSNHIPYRNSPLTKILRSSLGGNSRTLIILCITPSLVQVEQTMSTLRFGMNAKKIENKVQANIITNNDDEALKILIADYEKKLRDFESNRQEDQHNNHNLHRQIEDLQYQKSKLIERLSNMSKLQLGRFAEHIPEDELKQFFEQAQSQMIHFKKAGILFTSKRMQKYEKRLNKATKEAAQNGKNRSSSPFETRKNSNCTGASGSKSNTKLNNVELTDDEENGGKTAQEAMFDAQGKFALQAVRAFKRQNNILLRKVISLEENFKNLMRKYLDANDKVLTYQQKAEKRRMKLKDVGNKFYEEIDENIDLSKELFLYKDLTGVSDLSDSELADMERHFFEKLDALKSEKMRREYKKEINSLRAQLKIQAMESPTVDRTSDRKIIKKEDMRAYLMMENVDYEEFPEINMQTNFEQYKQYKRLVEEEALITYFKSIIEPINQELAEASKIVEETDPQVRRPDTVIKIADIEKALKKKEVKSAKKKTQESSFKLDVATNIMDYNVEFQKYANLDFLKYSDKKDSSAKDHKISHTPSISTQIDLSNCVPQILFGESSEPTKNEGEIISGLSSVRKTSVSGIPQDLSKTNSPTHAKKHSIGSESCETTTTTTARHPINNHSEAPQRREQPPLPPSNFKENANSFETLTYVSPKGLTLKSTIIKPVLSQNPTANRPSKKTKTLDFNDFKANKPLAPISMNTANNRRTSKSPVSVFRSKSPTPTYSKGSVIAKDVSPFRGKPKMQTMKVNPASSSDKLDDIFTVYKQMREDPYHKGKAVEMIPDDIPCHPQRADTLSDMVSVERDFNMKCHEEIQALQQDDFKMYEVRENGGDDRMGLNMTRIDKEDTFFSNSIFSTQHLERVESMDMNMMKLDAAAYNVNNMLRNMDNSPSNNRDDDLSEGSTDINDNRRRRTRAERHKTKA
jgi:hypothetical protein